MCMISGKIEKVNNTKIFAANIGNHKQLTVYSNDVQLSNTQKPVAMILPYPKSKTPVQVIETNSLDNGFFHDMNACFPSSEGMTLTFGRGKILKSATDYLPVLRSGNYQYSLAHSTQDLNRINPDVFRITGPLQSLLQDYENNHFAFIVCIIDSSAAYSPFAYITGIVNAQIFVPTKHYHEHETSSSGFGLLSDVYQWGSSGAYSDDWDHSIYLLNTGQTGNALQSFQNKKRYSFADYLSPYPTEKMHKITMIGRHPNNDVVVSAA
jgi:hypothetical protein